MRQTLGGDMRCARRGCRSAALATRLGAPAQLGGSGGRQLLSAIRHPLDTAVGGLAALGSILYAGNMQRPF
jgi:hypothetical protein